MGVSGLTTLTQSREEVRGGIFSVKILEEIRKFKKHMNKDPVIIFDFSPLQYVQNNTGDIIASFFDCAPS